jgi:8-oxo-dGTP pyrophosphatase MutT (NUDIX family)
MKVIAAGLFLVNKDGKLLVCHPTNHDPNFWSIPKGKVDSGENIIDAAIRETREESNMVIPKDSNFIELPMVNYSHKKKALYSFLVLEEQNPLFNWNIVELKCNSVVPVERGEFPEMDDFKWVDLDEAKLILHQTQAYLIDDIKRIINKVKNTVLG